MKNHKMIGWVVGIPLLVVIMILIIVFHEPEKEGITRAVAVKSVALAVVSPEDLTRWREEEKASRFPADELENWYVVYFDYLYGLGYLDEEDTPADAAHAEGQLTYGEARRMAAAVDPALEELVKMTKKNQEKPYPEESWWLLYGELLKKADPEGQMKTETVLVYGTPKNIPGAPAWTAYTNLGSLGFSGLGLDRYIDHALKAYVRGGEIVHVLEDQGQNAVYRNVWLIDGDEKELEVFLGDVRRIIPLKKKSKKIDGLVHNLADIQMSDGQVTKISLKKEKITGKVLSVRPEAIEIEGYGSVPLDEEYKVLKTYGQVERKKLQDILVGYDAEEFVVAKGKICAALTVRAFEADTIRVLLMTTGFKQLYHDTVTVACAGGMTVIQGEDEKKLEPGTELTFTKGDEALKAGRVMVKAGDGSELQVKTLERSQGVPSYGGRLEILDSPEGLVLINELYLEDYLKKVVPSEMPSSYEKEALKAQAVCARTYAYMQLQSNTYSQYGAHVDDSTNFQVYNNIETDGRTAEAVQETYGKMLLYEGNPISAYYFSTSCGSTSDATVWGSDPADTPYLKSISLQPGRKHLLLGKNDDFAAFIKQTDYPSYDASFPFYRWNVTTSATILTANIGGVGTVEKVAVTERGPGGVALKLLVRGSDGEKTISGQNAIRAALGDESLTIRRKDGNTSEGWSSLPSGFLTVEEAGTDESGVKLFKIYGGGYGHGVGMSQNGAQGMAKDGMGYQDILTFFYDGVSVEELRQESGTEG